MPPGLVSWLDHAGNSGSLTFDAATVRKATTPSTRPPEPETLRGWYRPTRGDVLNLTGVSVNAPAQQQEPIDGGAAEVSSDGRSARRSMTMSHPEHPLLAVDMPHHEGETAEEAIQFRALPITLFGIHSAVMAGVQSLEDYAARLDADGLCREHPGW